jgi:hypothetical protein
MPGSTIRNLDINQPLIYVLRPPIASGQYRVRCSQYHNAMDEISNTDLFQDRTPRPYIHFEKMSEAGNMDEIVIKEKGNWMQHLAQAAFHRIEPTTKCRYSWQDDLTKCIKDSVLDYFIRNTSVDEFAKIKQSRTV